jgi:CAAX protease family protein
MTPWRPIGVFLLIAIGTTIAIALITASKGWTVTSPAWILLAPVAMWAPAVGRLVARRAADQGYTPPLSLRRWGTSGAMVVIRPLAIPVLVYGFAYAVAWCMGRAHWNPGEGKWTSGGQIAANLVINLIILAVYGTFTAMGEELGWRGYLQPRLDAAGVTASVLVVWVCWAIYHVPLMLGAGYVNAGGFRTSLALFVVALLPMTFLMAYESYRAVSIWPAVFLHSFHNTVSQWLFPKLLTVSADQIWLQGEDGILPLAGYSVLGLLMYLSMRRQHGSWAAFARTAVRTGV